MDFWNQDMVNLLSADVKLRQELGKYFDKNEGSEGMYTSFICAVLCTLDGLRKFQEKNIVIVI